MYNVYCNEEYYPERKHVIRTIIIYEAASEVFETLTLIVLRRNAK